MVAVIQGRWGELLMDLCSVTVAGFRRFRARSSLKTNGKLVALLGPNEAGKSSLLSAIALLGHDAPPAQGDYARGENPDTFLIEGRYYLSPDDVKAGGLTTQRWLKVVKRADGQRKYSIQPSPPLRDREPRQRLAACLEAARKSAKFGPRVVAAGLYEQYEDITAIITSDEDDLEPEAIEKVESFVSSLASHITDRDISIVRRIPDLIQKFIEVETSENPSAVALKVLKSRLPEILFFDEEARALASAYDLGKLNEGVPKALANLFAIADLNIRDLLSAHGSGNTAGVTTLEHGANARLKDRFTKDWKQSGISVSLRVHDGQLSVQVVNNKFEFTSFAERSDGLRQFVALQSFATGSHSGSTILLIDEADQKLHYDAQADLVQMLARQQLATKVIYTTHSAGCLPEDLGNGVRFARPHLDDETRSEISNKFWARNEAGFAPLLIGMGASTLAFFPTRNAVVVEGPSDMLLLPTMFREALGRDVLGFQFVPGLSNFEADGAIHAAGLGNENGILYLVDSDAGGMKIKDRLLKRGVKKEDIFLLRSNDGHAKEVEEFLNATLLIDAANRILEKYHASSAPITKEDLLPRVRLPDLEKIFRQKAGAPLSKVDLAYEILDLLAEAPDRQMLAPNRRLNLSTIATSMVKRFELRSKLEV